MERSDKKLTLLQKGALQKTFAFLVYACIASSLAFLLDHIDKRMSGIHLAIPVFSKGYRPKQGKVAP